MVGDYEDPTQAFLVVDCQVVMEVNIEDIPLALMSAFNIHYPKGCSNFYAFMEVYTLGFPMSKASPTVRHFAAGLVDD